MSDLFKDLWAGKAPGALLTSYGPKDYIGAVPAVSGTLFFDDAHLPAVRNAICSCFEQFCEQVKPPFTWLFREDPPEGPDAQPFAKAPSLEHMMKRLDADDLINFLYSSGMKKIDAGPWEFHIYGLREWRAKMGGWGLCALHFSVPVCFLDERPGVVERMFIDFARELRAEHGFAGYRLVLSALEFSENQAFETYAASHFRGFDAGELLSSASNAHLGIKTVGWLTAISNAYLEKIGGEPALRSELPMDWFRLTSYDAGIVIQAGPGPQAAPVGELLPALLVLPNRLLRPLRTPEVHIHYASGVGEPRLLGKAAQQWLQRFDISEEALLEYKAKLLDEPKLTDKPGLLDASKLLDT